MRRFFPREGKFAFSVCQKNFRFQNRKLCFSYLLPMFYSIQTWVDLVLLIKAKFWVDKHLKTAGQLHEHAGRGQHVYMHSRVYHSQ